MQQIRLQGIVIGLFLLSSSSSYALPVFKSSGLGAKKEITNSPAKDLSLNTPKAEIPNLVTEEINETDIKAKLKKYEIILSQEHQIKSRIPIYFNQIVCYIQLARLNRIKTGGKNLGEEEKHYLNQALNQIESILKEKNLPNQMIGQLIYFQGIGYLDFGLKEKSYQSFEKSIETYPENLFVPSLSLYLADLDYQDGKLDKAIAGYKRFYSRMGQQEKDLADYKLAWISLNQSQVDQAIDIFLSLAKKSTSASIVQDAILSGSVALSEKFSQELILEKLDKAKLPEESKSKILWGVYDSFLNQPQKARGKIWLQILKSETSDEGILKLISSEIQRINFQNKIKEEIVFVKKIQEYIQANPHRFKKISSTLRESLGQDFESLISKSLELYNKDKSDINYQALESTVESYLKVGVLERSDEVYSLYVDLLVEKKEDKKLQSLCLEILKNSSDQKLRDKAKLLVLLDYEKKYLAEPNTHQTAFFKLVRIYLKNVKADQWESVAQKFCDYLISAKMYNEAEEVAFTLNQNYPKEDYFLRLMAIKFELKKCSDIISLLADNKFNTKKFLEYKRECHLHIAQNAKEKKDSSLYQENIQSFMALSEGNKKNTAAADYLMTLARSEDQSLKLKYQELLDKDFFNLRFEKEVFPIYQREILKNVSEGNFAKALFYLNNCEISPSCTSFVALANNLRAVTKIDSLKGSKPILDQNQKSDYSNYLPLILPEFFLYQFNKGKKISPSDFQHILVAAHLASIDWNDVENKKLYEKIAHLLNKNEKPAIYSASIERLDKINFPSGNSRHRLNDHAVLALIKKTQETRQIVLNDLALYGITAQKIILTKAMNVEERMAEVIKLSPLPKNLNPEQKQEYENGLNHLAEEFHVQAESYRKSIASLDLQKSNQVPDSYENIQAPLDLKKWNWGNEDEFSERVKKFVQQEDFAQGLFYLDYLLSLKKISMEDYFSRRSGVLLLSAVKRNKVSPMVKYVWDECESNKQVSLIESWLQRSKQ